MILYLWNSLDTFSEASNKGMGKSQKPLAVVIHNNNQKSQIAEKHNILSNLILLEHDIDTRVK